MIRVTHLAATLLAPAAALVTPVYLMTGRWRRLLAPSAAPAAAPARSAARAAARAATPASIDPALRDAIRITAGITRRLARIPLSPWKATCLYRAVAVCIMLRWAGVNAILRIGVQRGTSHPDGTELAAHAWVETAAGDVVYEQPGDYIPLAGAR
jgi:hypothetical protein